MDSNPQHPEQIVQQSGGQSQSDRLDYRPGLGRHIRRHPPSSRAKQPHPLPACVLIGHGVHGSFHLQVSPVQRQLFNMQILSPAQPRFP